MRKQPPYVRAFVSWTRRDSVGRLAHLLESLGVRLEDPLATVSSEAPPIATALDAIRACDVGIIIYRPDTSYLMYELGALDALKKPLIILSDGRHELPSILLRYLTVQADSLDSDAVAEALRSFVEQVSTAKVTGKTRQRTNPNSPNKTKAGADRRSFDVTDLLSAEALAAAAPQDVERTVRLLFKRAGGIVSAHELKGERSADFALWSHAPSDALPRPVLVEVKAGRLSPESLRDAEVRLEAAVRKSGASAGLLVYVDRDGREFAHPPSSGGVTRVSLATVFSELTSHSLTKALHRLLVQSKELSHG